MLFSFDILRERYQGMKNAHLTKSVSNWLIDKLKVDLLDGSTSKDKTPKCKLEYSKPVVNDGKISLIL
jgi:hypothetical protein